MDTMLVKTCKFKSSFHYFSVTRDILELHSNVNRQCTWGMSFQQMAESLMLVINSKR